jgi:helicase
VYAASELARIRKLKNRPHLQKLGVQVKYGVKEELIPLVALRGVGRVRARTLHNNGIKTLEDVKKTNKPRLASFVGVKTAENIKKQVG